MEMLIRCFCMLILTGMLSACGEKKPDELKIALNPWPGYEFLYLAGHQGFFEEVGLNATFIELSSLSDTQRALLNGYANAMTSTLIEAVQTAALGKQALKIVLVTDYSNGGDVIVTSKDNPDMSSLKGKTIGCEVSSLGIFVLERALKKSGLTLEDVVVKNIEQNQGEKAMLDGSIDAYVSYPPVSVNILKNENMHVIFSSAEIPGEVVDIVSVSESYLKKYPETVSQLRDAWRMALDYYEKNPKEAVEIMAKRERISPEDFTAVLSDLKLLDFEDQKRLFAQPNILQNSVVQVCETLTHIGSIDANCENFPYLVHRELN